MLIAQISGGLGNQLFQYAFVRSLALRLNQKYKLDLSWYYDFEKYDNSDNPNVNTRRAYLLNKFNISEKLLSRNYLRIAHRIRHSSVLCNLEFYPVKYFKFKRINESDFDIDKIPKYENLYFGGYWQNSKIFEDHADLFKSEFTLKNKMSLENQELLDKINSTNSVALHIRRGDLLSRPATVLKALDSPCLSENYYSNAINIISKKIKSVNLYIFSDEIDWVKNNKEFNAPPTFVDTKGPDYEHFVLMCKCKHQIIANSTFSWWAAWLNSYAKKIVISPKWWYRDKKKNESIIRIPQDWIKIENMDS